MSERLQAWGVIHNGHGTHVDRVCFLPDGEKPDTDIAWVRLPWLDEPEPDSFRVRVARLADALPVNHEADALATKALNRAREKQGPGRKLTMPALTDEDREALEFAKSVVEAQPADAPAVYLKDCGTATRVLSKLLQAGEVKK